MCWVWSNGKKKFPVLKVSILRSRIYSKTNREDSIFNPSYSAVLIHFVLLFKIEALPDIIKIGNWKTSLLICQKQVLTLKDTNLFQQLKVYFNLNKIITSGGLFDVTDQVKQDSSQSRQEIAFRWFMSKCNNDINIHH